MKKLIKTFLISLLTLNFFSATNAMKQTPEQEMPDLHQAARYGNTLVVSSLVRSGAFIDLPDADFRTALHHSLFAYTNKEQTIRLLLRLNINVNAPDKNGSTALHLAISIGDINTIKLLLRNDAMVHAKDLDLALKGGMQNQQEIVELLLPRRNIF